MKVERKLNAAHGQHMQSALLDSENKGVLLEYSSTYPAKVGPNAEILLCQSTESFTYP